VSVSLGRPGWGFSSGVGADLVGELSDQPRSGVQVWFPVGVSGKRVGNARPPKRARICSAVTGSPAPRPSIQDTPEPIQAPGLSPRSA
jgi:hypothetical protein